MTVIQKEFIDTLRDRRTLLSAVLLPAVAIPLMLLAITKIQTSVAEKDANKTLTVGLSEAPEAFRQQLAQDSLLILSAPESSTGQQAVEAESLDALIAFDPAFSTQVDEVKSGQVAMYFKSTNSQVKQRLSAHLDQYRDAMLQDRIAMLDLAPEALAPVVIHEQDMASTREQIGQLAGGFLPYIFIMLSFVGCMYPALDLISGEKERGTLETLLTVPSARLHILLGKMAVIAIMGLSSALIAVGGMAVGVNFLPQIPPALLETINGVLAPSFIAILITMMVPLALFFAGLLTAVVVRAKNFKEAQSLVTPISFLLIVPAMLAIVPGIELNWQTVWIPILNIALATKAAVANTLDTSHLATIVLSLMLLAVGAIVISVRRFSHESTVLS